MRNVEEQDTGPWYLHFWPWFLVALLGISVAASLWTVHVAFGLGDLSIPAEAGPASGSSGERA